MQLRLTWPKFAKTCVTSQLSDDSTAESAHGMAAQNQDLKAGASRQSIEALLCTESMLGAEAQSLAVDKASAPVGDDDEVVERHSTDSPDVLELNLEFCANASAIVAFNMAILAQDG